MRNFWVLIIILLVVAILFQVDFIFFVVYVCLGIYAWNRFYTPYVMGKVTLARDFTDHAFLNETVTAVVRLTNSSWLPLPWLQFSESIPPELNKGDVINQVTTLAGYKTLEVRYQVKAFRRGYYRLGPMRALSSDLFGFFSDQIAYLPSDYLTVYPRIIPLTKLGLPSRLPFGTLSSTQRLFEDPARPMGVRDFRSGDSLRQINWKVSAHTRNLMVKTFQPAISLETAVLLNLHLDDYDRKTRLDSTEWAIQIAASLSAHLVNQRQPVGLIANGLDPLQGQDRQNLQFDEGSGRLNLSTDGTMKMTTIMPRPGRPHLMKILEHLARVEAGQTISFNEWAPTACLNLSWGVTILAITSRGDEATCHTLHRLLRAGFNPVLIVVEPTYNFAQVRERARRLGFHAYHVTNIQDLDDWRQPLRTF